MILLLQFPSIHRDDSTELPAQEGNLQLVALLAEPLDEETRWNDEVTFMYS